MSVKDYYPLSPILDRLVYDNLDNELDYYIDDVYLPEPFYDFDKINSEIITIENGKPIKLKPNPPGTIKLNLVENFDLEKHFIEALNFALKDKEEIITDFKKTKNRDTISDNLFIGEFPYMYICSNKKTSYAIKMEMLKRKHYGLASQLINLDLNLRDGQVLTFESPELFGVYCVQGNKSNFAFANNIKLYKLELDQKYYDEFIVKDIIK